MIGFLKIFVCFTFKYPYSIFIIVYKHYIYKKKIIFKALFDILWYYKDMKRKRDNIINLIIVIAVIIGVCLFIYFSVNKNKDTKVINLNVNQLKEKINNNDSFVLIITKDDCSHCKLFIPVMESIGSDYNLNFYEVSLSNLNNEDYTYLKNIANISGTPTTIFIEKGEEKNTANRLVGETPKYRVIEKLKDMGYING